MRTPTATALQGEAAERSHVTAGSPDAAPKKATGATEAEPTATENVATIFEKAEISEQGEPKQDAGLQSAAPKPPASQPRSVVSIPGMSTPVNEMEESVDRSADRQGRTLRDSKLVVACFALTVLMLFVVSAIVVYMYVVKPEMLVAAVRRNKLKKKPRVGNSSEQSEHQEKRMPPFLLKVQ